MSEDIRAVIRVEDRASGRLAVARQLAVDMGLKLTSDHVSSYHAMSDHLRLTAAGMERVAAAMREVWGAEGARRRSEAYLRQFHRRYRLQFLLGAMKWAVIAEWRSATR